MKAKAKAKTNDGRARFVALFVSLLALPAADVSGQAPDPALDGPRAEAAPAEGGSTLGPLRRSRDAFIAVGDFAAALGPAEQVVNRPEAAADPALPEDLARLARIQAELDDFESAELSYLKAIELIQAAEGDFAIELLEPYQGLGRSYIKNRQFPEAITALEQAQHISQRNLGLFNVTQSDLIDDLTNAHLGLGDTVEAQRLQLERLDNAIRRFGPDDPEVIPFRYQLASYYDESRMREAAREQYEHVVTLLEALPDASDDARLPPLRQLLRIETLLRDEDEARLKLESLLASNPDIDAVERAHSLAALGDSAIAREDAPGAHAYYRQAYELLRQAPAGEIEAAFGQPAPLDFIAPLSAVDRAARRDPYAWGSIVLAFDVSADGHASSVAAVAADPPGVMDTEYVQRVRETHFRPRVVDAQPLPTAGVRFTHYFRYYVRD